MANQIIDPSIVNGIRSDLNDIQNTIRYKQYTYEDGKSANGTVVGNGLLRTSTQSGMSVYTTTSRILITKPLMVVTIVPKGYFTNKPVVTAMVECPNPPGAIVPVVTNINASNQITLNIYTSGTISQTGINAYLHLTAISYA